MKKKLFSLLLVALIFIPHNVKAETVPDNYCNNRCPGKCIVGTPANNKSCSVESDCGSKFLSGTYSCYNSKCYYKNEAFVCSESNSELKSIKMTVKSGSTTFTSSSKSAVVCAEGVGATLKNPSYRITDAAWNDTAAMASVRQVSSNGGVFCYEVTQTATPNAAGTFLLYVTEAVSGSVSKSGQTRFSLYYDEANGTPYTRTDEPSVFEEDPTNPDTPGSQGTPQEPDFDFGEIVFGEGTGKCDEILGEGITKVIKICFTILKIFTVAYCIVAGMLAFIPAITGKNNDLSKALKKLVKMLIVAVVIMLLPTFIKVIGALFGFDLSCFM